MNERMNAEYINFVATFILYVCKYPNIKKKKKKEENENNLNHLDFNHSYIYLTRD